MSCIRKLPLISLIFILFMLWGCSPLKTYNITNLDAQGIINQIPIRVIENSKKGDLDITGSVAVNNKRKIEYQMELNLPGMTHFIRDNMMCSLELPEKIINFDMDYQYSNRGNVFLGSQKYSINNSIYNTGYFGFGYQRNFEKWGFRADIFYYNYENSYIATIVDYDDNPDSLLYEKNNRYENILTSITINFYKNNLFLNLSETPYFKDSIGPLEIGGATLRKAIISRRMRTIFSAGYYKEINNISAIAGFAFLPGYNRKDDLFKYFMQLSIKLNYK